MNDPPSRRSRPWPTLADRYVLGPDGRGVSPICLGATVSPDVLCEAFDAGINFFFVTCDMHWPRYEMCRRGLERLLARRRSLRDEIVVAAVTYLTQPEFCWKPLDELIEVLPSLRSIDMCVAGGVYNRDWPHRRAVLDEQRQQRYLGAWSIGASFHERAAAVKAINEPAVDLAFVRYNPRHPGARRDLFPRLRAEGGALVYNFNSAHAYVRPSRFPSLGLSQQHWQPEVTDYYRFALTRPEIGGLLVALDTPGHVAELVDALGRGPLSPEEERYLLDLGKLDMGTYRLA
ncbi:MAG TPA: hypothetical protein VH877_16750 [Polyangia bacterium]|nr:hypothetical protein [Polyangia bacterium]